MITITLSSFTRAVHAAIATRPADYVYMIDDALRCQYTRTQDGTDGGCLIGIALMSLGVSQDYLRQVDNHPNGANDANGVFRQMINGSVIDFPTERDERKVTSRASRLQILQDSGMTWRETWRAVMGEEYDPSGWSEPQA